MSRRVSVRAPAKVNLALHVLGRRPDGYHELDTLFQAIDLCDDVELEVVEGTESSRVALVVEGTDLGPEEENLAYQAAVRFLHETRAAAEVRVRLRKRIPVGAGLGGGSSDAAAVLRCLDSLLGPVERAPLSAVGAAIGSDVPFFLGASPLARGRGKGEKLDPLPALPPADLVVVSPPVHVSTAGAYAALSEVRGGERPAVRQGLTLLPGRWPELSALAHNDFEPVISAAHPEVRRALGALRGADAATVLMAGSGSTCFGMFADRAAAERVAADLSARLGWACRAVRTLEVWPAPRKG